MSLETEFKALSRDELKERWLKAYGTAPPKRIASTMMARILTCDHQWKTSGPSRAACAGKLRSVLEAAEAEKPVAASGTRLVREWNGQEHIVDVTDTGYLWKGKPWRSLSAIAKEITGTKWSGPRFFGVQG